MQGDNATAHAGDFGRHHPQPRRYTSVCPNTTAPQTTQMLCDTGRQPVKRLRLMVHAFIRSQ
jgi:hypothetical protein